MHAIVHAPADAPPPGRRHPGTRIELALADPVEQPSREGLFVEHQRADRRLIAAVRAPHADVDRAFVCRRKPAKAECAGLRADRRLTEPFRELDDATRFGVGRLEVAAFHRGVSQPGPCLRFALRQPSPTAMSRIVVKRATA